MHTTKPLFVLLLAMGALSLAFFTSCGAMQVQREKTNMSKLGKGAHEVQAKVEKTFSQEGGLQPEVIVLAIAWFVGLQLIFWDISVLLPNPTPGTPLYWLMLGMVPGALLACCLLTYFYY